MNLNTLDRRPLNRRQFLKGAGLLLATPALAGIAGCAAPSAGNSPTQGSSFDGNLIVGFDQDFPPYGFVGDDGSFTGFDLDLAKAVCEMEGWTFTPKAIAWDAKDGLLNSGQITCIWNGFTIEGREKDYAFTSAYMENRQVVVVRSGSGITDLAGLAGKNVITQADSAAYDLLGAGGSQAKLGATFAQLQTIGEYNTAFMMLESGSVDAVAVDYPVATYNIGDKTATFEILSESLNSEHFGVGFAANDAGRDLAAKVEADLKKLDANGKVKELCEKYADKGISYDLWVLPKA
jgi:polar amino acid transport system substrate-binding protein